ncbi:MAG: hypothetical protein QOF98_1444, partial [Streptomyces sp.]|nr:hypothetical protein [Streptomyces sp.]
MNTHKRNNRLRAGVAGAAALGLLGALAAGQAAGATPSRTHWQPEAASYGVSAPVHTTVTMDDGVSISV